MLRLRPPQHSIDDHAFWIAPTDCWDKERVEAEKRRLVEAALADLPTLPADAADELREADEAKRRELSQAAQAKHPVNVWYAGATRFSEHALITVPEELRTDEHPEPAVRIGEYLLGEPARWVLRSVGHNVYRQVRKISDTNEWQLTLVRHGLVRVEAEDEDGAPLVIEFDRDAAGRITEAGIDWIDQQSRTLIFGLASAIFLFSSRGRGDEGKP